MLLPEVMQTKKNENMMKMVFWQQLRKTNPRDNYFKKKQWRRFFSFPVTMEKEIANHAQIPEKGQRRGDRSIRWRLNK